MKYNRVASVTVVGTAVFLSIFVVFGAASLGASPMHWTKGDRSCDLSEGVRIACGNYGVFYVDGDEQEVCDGGISGVDNPNTYPLPIEAPELSPAPTEPLQGLTVGRASRWGSGEGFEPTGELPTAPWIALVDFLFQDHGLAVQWLTEELSVGTNQSQLFFVDDPSLTADLGGDIGDFHLMASLCSIAELVDIEGAPPPSVVNMSLGRLVVFDDDVNLETCKSGRLLCQISRIVEHIRRKGVNIVAAGGNHREELIPAALSNVVSSVSADLRVLLQDHKAQKAWEAPVEAAGIFPTSGLCLRGGAAAAAGSSYASAMLSGWLGQISEQQPGLDALGPRSWKPLWRPDLRCFVLSADGTPFSGCNAAFDEVISELSGGPGNCWEPPSDRVVYGGLMGSAVEFPDYMSFDEWAALHPTPEADPCVPCMGGPSDNLLGSNDLVINISKSKALPENEYVREIYVRIGAELFPLNLSNDDLLAIRNGQVDYLWLPGWGSLVNFHASASVFYVVANNTMIDCSQAPTQCFWSSSQVTWHPGLQ